MSGKRGSLLGRSGAWRFLAFAGCALIAAAARPAPAEAGALVTGLGGLDSYEPLALQQAGGAGIRMVRITIFWAGVAPSREPVGWNPEDPADPNYNWTLADLATRATVEAGLTPVVTIEGAPPWAQRCTVSGSGAGRLCDPSPTALGAFAIAAASRYDGRFEGLPRVRYWQGLNEPNLSLFFNPQYRYGRPVSPGLYRKLANAFYFAVKWVDPSDLVLAAGLGPLRVKHLTVGPIRFTRELLCMRGRVRFQRAPGNCEGGVHFDIFDIHPYTTGGPKHTGGRDDVEIGSLGRLVRLLHAADRAGRIKGRFGRTPLWITEFSWDSSPPDPGGLPMRIETRWTAEALYRAWSAGVTHFFWFSLADFPRESRSSSENMESGLYFRGATLAENRPKQVMYAFRFPFVAYSTRSGFSFWGRTPTSAGGRVVIQVLKGRRWRRMSVARANGSGIFRGVVRTRYGRNRRGTVQAIYAGESSVPFSLHPVREFDQPPFGRPVP
jgi:hypothetical protein